MKQRFFGLFVLWIFLAAGLSLMSGYCLAQGGQGGFGGGQGGRGANALRGDGEESTFNHILTPGDKAEWPLNMRDGETILVTVSSNVFDPAVQVVDAAGKVIAENDDIRPGEQSARVLSHFPKAGAYKILVLGFKSKSGGPYALTLRRFTPMDAPIGARSTGTLAKSGTKWLRLPIMQDSTLVVTVNAAAFLPEVVIFSPSGESLRATEFRSAGNRAVRMSFRMTEKGNYYAAIAKQNGNGSSFAATISTARVFQTEIGQANPSRQIGTGGLDLWTFKGKAGELIRIDARAATGTLNARLQAVPTAGKGEEAEEGSDAANVFMPLPANSKSEGTIVALLRQTRTYQVALAEPQARAIEYSLTTSHPGRAWDAAAASNASLKLNDSEYWSIPATTGQILRFEGHAAPFDMDLELYNPRGERILSNDDGSGGTDSLLTALLTENGTYLLRVHAHGDGGGGAYGLSRIPNPLKILLRGGKGEGRVGTGGEEIWSYTGKANETIILSVRSSEFDSFVKVFGPDGVEVAENDDGGEGTDSLLSVRLPVDGTYTFWVSPQSGSGKYTIRVLNAD